MKTDYAIRPLKGHSPEEAYDLVQFVGSIAETIKLPFETAYPQLMGMYYKLNDNEKGVAKDPVRSAILEGTIHGLCRAHYTKEILLAEQQKNLLGLDALNTLFASISVNEDDLRESAIAAYERLTRVLCFAYESRAKDLYERMQTHSKMLAKPALQAWVIKTHYLQYTDCIVIPSHQ